MIKGNLSDFINDRQWLIGAFIKDEPFHNESFEVKWATHECGDDSGVVKYNPYKTLSVLISGYFKISFPEDSSVIYLRDVGDFVYAGKGMPHYWEAISDSLTLTLRWV